ncbi:hypothetical protein SprV_0501821800 [Sparganum proliferum]
MQDACVDRKTDEIQEYWDHNETNNFLASNKAAYGLKVKRTSPIHGSDGIISHTKESETLKRGFKHIRTDASIGQLS